MMMMCEFLENVSELPRSFDEDRRPRVRAALGVKSNRGEGEKVSLLAQGDIAVYMFDKHSGQLKI